MSFRTMTLCLLAAVVAVPAFAQQTACGLTRGDVTQALEQGISAEQISADHDNCANTAQTMSLTKQTTTPTGSIFWEEIDACGYHPQRRELDCAVEVKQQFGFAGFPAVGPGSWEWIQFCVDYGAGLVPVNISAVHVHDEQFGVQPPWYYGVSVAADTTLHQALVNGQTLQARAILSWTLIPTGCNYIPVWGNQADFQIKLDP